LAFIIFYSPFSTIAFKLKCPKYNRKGKRKKERKYLRKEEGIG
jgi:hypothetical protein